MLFQPNKPCKMWDTWLYHHNNMHYLYYLHKSTGEVCDGMSVATSRDGVHYEEIGPIIHKRDDAEWLGTGSVWKVEDGFMLNFSEKRQGVQAIFFARSNDLIHWERMGDEYRSDPDPQWYDDTSTGRWDCIWVVPRPEGGFWGYLTARPWNKIAGIRFESVGRVESKDGIHWSAALPPEFDWGDWPQMSLGEVGAIDKIGDRYYLMLGYAERGLGNRQVWDYLLGNWGMYCFVADDPAGPFAPDQKAYRLLVSNGTYFARFYPTPEGMLVNHHSIETLGGDPRDVWFAPLKRAVLQDGHLRLGYWSGNDVMKGSETRIDLTSHTKLYPRADIGKWTVTANRLEADEPAHGGIALLEPVFDIHQGIVLEGTVEIHKPPKRWSGAGIYIELEQTGEHREGIVIMAQTRGRTEVMTLNDKGVVTPVFRTEIGAEEGKKYQFRLLLRRTMTEFYLDDLLVQCYSLPGEPTGKIGIALESGRAVFENLRAWQMNI